MRNTFHLNNLSADGISATPHFAAAGASKMNACLAPSSDFAADNDIGATKLASIVVPSPEQMKTPEQRFSSRQNENGQDTNQGCQSTPE